MSATTLGAELRALRENSPYRYQADLAERCGVSRRNLQYVEADKVVPRVETLERILAVTGASPTTAQRLRLLRDRAQAERDGFSPVQRDELQIPRLAERVVSDAVHYLRRYHRVTDYEARVLYGRVAKVIADVLQGGSP